MPTERDITLKDLLNAIPRHEIKKMIARRGRVSAAAFVEVLHSDLDATIERLEATAHHYARDSAEKLTSFLAAQLAAIGYNTTCESSNPDQATLKIDSHSAQTVWIAEANLYRSHTQNLAGILRLFTRTSGRHTHAGFLFFIREGGVAPIIEDWMQALQRDHRVACHAVIRGKAACVFTSSHTHPSSMLPITIRHHAVLMGRTNSASESPSPKRDTPSCS